MGWIFYSFLAAILWAIVNVTDKYTMVKLVSSPVIPVLILGVVGLLTAGGVYFAHGVELFSPLNSALAFLAGLFYILTMLFYFLALKSEEVSKVIPIYYLAPVFIFFIAKAGLNEHLISNQYWGIALLVSGAIIISLSSPIKIGISKGIMCVLLAAFCYAINQVLTKFLIENNEFWSVFAYTRLGVFLSLLPFMGYYFIYVYPESKKIQHRAYVIMITNQLLNVGGVFCITLAMTTGDVTLVNGLASTQPFFVLVFTAMLGFYFPTVLKEKFAGWVLIQKLIATILTFAGVLIISQ